MIVTDVYQDKKIKIYLGYYKMKKISYLALIFLGLLWRYGKIFSATHKQKFYS